MKELCGTFIYLEKKYIHGPWKSITYEFACDANRWNWKFNLSKNNSFFLCWSSLTLSNSFWLHSNSFSFDVFVVLKAIHSVSSYTFIINIYVWFHAFCKIDYRPWTSWDVRWAVDGTNIRRLAGEIEKKQEEQNTHPQNY